MASCTKIIVTATLTLIAIEQGLLNLNDNVDKFFTCPSDKKEWTIKNLLTHTIGFGHKALNCEGNNYENIVNFILQIACDIPPNTNVLYSCPGYILLGKILEKVYNMRLDEAFYRYVFNPLKMGRTHFSPILDDNVVNSNLDKGKMGIVNDYNCQFLGGVCGNAGLFSNLKNVTMYVKYILNDGKPLIDKKLFLEAVSNQTQSMDSSRGLGFLYVDEKYKQTGKLFNVGTVGHCGHTGRSIFVDRKTGLYVIILPDITLNIEKNYKNDYGIVMSMREEIHDAIYNDLQRSEL